MTEGKQWDPRPAELREGEHRDDDNTHARRNAEQREIAREYREQEEAEE